MAQAKNKTEKKIKELEEKVANLRREVSMFIPTEKLEEYENQEEIKDHYKQATEDHPVDA